jgi:PadR family transcriptional regulator, regulatory protein PadR
MHGTVFSVEQIGQSQLLKGVLDLVVLSVLDRDDSYGYEVVRALRAAGLGEVGEASVYGTLRRLFRAGLLTSHVAASEEGPHRKYYGLTAEGRNRLEQAQKQWEQFRQAVETLLPLQARGKTK